LPGISPVAKDIRRSGFEISSKRYETKPHIEPWRSGIFKNSSLAEGTFDPTNTSASTMTFFGMRNQSQGQSKRDTLISSMDDQNPDLRAVKSKR
jgi:hypothetical protein